MSRRPPRLIGLLSLAAGCALAAAIGYVNVDAMMRLMEPTLSAWSSPAGSAEPTVQSSGAAVSGRASVIDGDTLEIHGTRIRLSGIDAPESSQHCRDRRTGSAILCGGRAAAAMADLIGGAVVTCMRDGTDTYGRMLAHCRARGVDLGDAIVRRGWALSFVRYSHEYDVAEAEARATGRGLWAMEFQAPWEWRRANRTR